ncbi:hypothetical protein BHE74_00016667 [Ensete ventricosum]|nr:hypothetical protein BHE74_00016667 [Ensete ventricosum]
MTVCIIPVNAWTCCTSPWKAFGETTNCPVPPPRGKSPGSLNNLQYTVGVYEEVFPSVEDGVGIGLPKLGESVYVALTFKPGPNIIYEGAFLLVQGPSIRLFPGPTLTSYTKTSVRRLEVPRLDPSDGQVSTGVEFLVERTSAFAEVLVADQAVWPTRLREPEAAEQGEDRSCCFGLRRFVSDKEDEELAAGGGGYVVVDKVPVVGDCKLAGAVVGDEGLDVGEGEAVESSLFSSSDSQPRRVLR